jgi:hypothetical protein
MINETVRIPRWRAVVLCLAGVLAMTKPLASGVSLYRSTLPVKVTNYSALYGWVDETGPFNSNEHWRAEQRLRVLGFPRTEFSETEIQQAAADVRNLGLAEIRRQRIEEDTKTRAALGDRAVAVLIATLGAGGMLFYLWLGYTLLHENPINDNKLPRAAWFGKRRRHRRITFGRQAV